jgi:hypothetical protein
MMSDDIEHHGAHDGDHQEGRVVDLTTGQSRRRWFGRRNDDEPSEVETLVALRPAPRSVPSTAAALDMACDWMRYFAFTDAVVSTGPDPLINSSRGLAYLMPDPRGVGSREIMRVHELATMAGKYALVFALGGFSSGAVRWADRNPTALFGFDGHGQVTAVSQTARRLLEGSDRRHLALMADQDLD